jgi:hypothetical protein
MHAPAGTCYSGADKTTLIEFLGEETQAIANLLQPESEQARPTLDPRLDKIGEK